MTSYFHQFLEQSNLPKKFVGYTITETVDFICKMCDTPDDFTLVIANFQNYVMEYIDKGKGFYICGPVGVAKTSLATAMCRHALHLFFDSGRRIRLSHYFCLASMLPGIWFNPNSGDERDRILNCKLLIIDDISRIAETKSKIDLTIIDTIIRFRDLNELSTIITSQIPLESSEKVFENVFSLQIKDIIRGNSRVIKIKGKSCR